MPISLDQFVKSLEESGVFAPGKLQEFQSSFSPEKKPKDGAELARELVRQRKLTKFQAQEAYQGKARSLVLGNYILLDRIGAGGMGQVFKARHRVMERTVAVKVLPATMTKDGEAAQRFHREVKAAARLSHPNIVTAHDADQAGESHFLVMEYVEGSDLAALVTKEGRLPIAKAIDYTLQAARGLDFAHKQGVVHRDIKPANLLVDAQGTVKILDMGLARIDVGDGAAGQAELTTAGTIVGTVDFMAPEQALDTHKVDARADIYSLGCSLYYLLIGKTMYSGATALDIIQAHQESSIPRVSDERLDAPANLEAVFRRMVAKQVDDRYSSMVQVIADLETCQRTLSDGSLDMPEADDEDKTSELTIALSHRPMRSISESAVMRPKQEVAQPQKKKPALSLPLLIGLATVAVIAVIVVTVVWLNW